MEFRHPAGERRQRGKVESQSGLRQQFRETFFGRQLLLKPKSALLVGNRGKADGDRRFLDGFADRGDGRIGKAEIGRESSGEGHAFGALDHQQLRRAAGAFAHDDQGCGGDRVVGHCQRT